VSDLPFNVTSLGDVIQKLCNIADDVLLEALHRQRTTGGLLGQHLIAMGVVSADDVARALDMQQSLRGANPLEAIGRLLGEQRAVRRRTNELAAFQVPPSNCGEG
jgi:hypothetical protein